MTLFIENYNSVFIIESKSSFCVLDELFKVRPIVSNSCANGFTPGHSITANSSSSNIQNKDENLSTNVYSLPIFKIFLLSSPCTKPVEFSDNLVKDSKHLSSGNISSISTLELTNQENQDVDDVPKLFSNVGLDTKPHLLNSYSTTDLENLKRINVGGGDSIIDYDVNNCQQNTLLNLPKYQSVFCLDSISDMITMPLYNKSNINADVTLTQ